jgi:hypothetical protein
MLYDPKWEQKTDDVFSLESLIAWLEKQPRDRRYDYIDTHNCLAACYYKDMGQEMRVVLLKDYPTAASPFSYKLEWIACHSDTYGEAIDHARKLQHS